MKHSILALTTRSLREDARAWTPHVARTVLVVLLLTQLIVANSESTQFSASGLIFFRGILLVNLAMIILVGGSVFASRITEEKEQMTLGLLKMAGMRPLTLLMGKSVGVLINGMLLIALQVPFMMLAISLGGISVEQIFAAYVLLLAFLFHVCGIALLCSVFFQHTGHATKFTFVAIAMLWLGPMTIGAAVDWLQINEFVSLQWRDTVTIRFVQPLNDTWVFYAAMRIISTTFAGPILSWPVIANIVGGVIWLTVAVRIFDRRTREMQSDSPQRPALTRPGAVDGRGRAWARAIEWKDFRFIAGGWAGLANWLFAYATILGVLVYMLGQVGAPIEEEWPTICFVGTLLMLVVHTGLITSSVFHQELRWRTWGTLKLLPISVAEIAYRKVAGTLPQLLPGIALLVVFSVLSYMLQRQVFSNLLEALFTSTIGWYIMASSFFGVHAAAFLSLWLQRGHLAMASGAMVIMLGLLITIVELQDRNNVENSPLFIVGSIVLGIGCVALHPLIIRRLGNIHTD